MFKQQAPPPPFLGGQSRMAGNSLGTASPVSPLQALILKLLIRKGMRAIGSAGAPPPSPFHAISGLPPHGKGF